MGLLLLRLPNDFGIQGQSGLALSIVASTRSTWANLPGLVSTCLSSLQRLFLTFLLLTGTKVSLMIAGIPVQEFLVSPEN